MMVVIAVLVVALIAVSLMLIKTKRECLKAKKVANLDELTKIYNRHKIEEHFKKMLTRKRSSDSRLVGIFFDIDHFKKVNDTFGHKVGDSVLHELSSIVAKSMREHDFFARWGGEEFIVLFEGEIEGGVKFAEKLRTLVEKHEFKKAGHITISLGVAKIYENEDENAFITRLDGAMYQAKQKGRNRTEVSE